MSRRRALPGSVDPVQCAAHRAVSSAVEHCLHTARVAGSNPAPPTNKIKGLRAIAALFSFWSEGPWSTYGPELLERDEAG